MARRTTTVAATAVLGLGLALGLSACGPDLRGPAETREVDVTDVTAVQLATPGDLTVRRGTTPSLTITTSEPVHDRLVNRVRDGVLTLGSRGDVGFGGVDIRYELVIGELEELVVSGSGDVEGVDVTGSEVRVLVEGSGEVDLEGVDADDVRVSVEGSGTVGLAGRAGSVRVSVGGSGEVGLDDLRVAAADVSIEGSGDVDLHVTDRLTVVIEGSGSVTYTGDPEVSEQIDGSGRVSRD